MTSGRSSIRAASRKAFAFGKGTCSLCVVNVWGAVTGAEAAGLDHSHGRGWIMQDGIDHDGIGHPGSEPMRREHIVRTHAKLNKGIRYISCAKRRDSRVTSTNCTIVRTDLVLRREARLDAPLRTQVELI